MYSYQQALPDFFIHNNYTFVGIFHNYTCSWIVTWIFMTFWRDVMSKYSLGEGFRGTYLNFLKIFLNGRHN